jgi:hypothetical protein
MADLATQAEVNAFFGAGWQPRMKHVDTFLFLDSLALPPPPNGWKWRLISTPTHWELISQHPEAAAIPVGCGTYLVLERALLRTDLRAPNHPGLSAGTPDHLDHKARPAD